MEREVMLGVCLASQTLTLSPLALVLLVEMSSPHALPLWETPAWGGHGNAAVLPLPRGS